MATETRWKESKKGMAGQSVNLIPSAKNLMDPRQPSPLTQAIHGPLGVLGETLHWSGPEMPESLDFLPSFDGRCETHREHDRCAFVPTYVRGYTTHYQPAEDLFELNVYDIVNKGIPADSFSRKLSGASLDSNAVLLGVLLKVAPSMWVVNRQEVPEIAEVEQATAQVHNVDTIGAARDRLALAVRDYERRDHEARLEQLREASSKLARREPRELLNVLAIERGLSWHTLATMLNVTPTAIRKWRRGGSLTPENREQLAALVAFFDLLENVREPIADLGSWIEMRVREDTTLTPAVMYARGLSERWLLLEWARGYIDTTMMLDRFDERWRENYVRDPNFVVGEGPGGERAILPR
jgi:hypothetical protein